LTEENFTGKIKLPSRNRIRLHPPALARKILDSTGFVLIDSRFRPVYANPESIRILGYPNFGPGACTEAVDSVLAQKILSFLPRDMSFAESACALQFRSGRRLYRCRAFVVCSHWNGADSEKRIALVLERGIPGRPLGIRQNRLFAGMYEDPFSFVSNPRFYHLSRAHQAVLNSMQTLVAERRGMGVLFGQSGIGKTALVNYLSERMRSEAQIAVFPGSFEDLSELVRSLMAILGVGGIQKNADANLEIFEQWLCSKHQEGRGVVLICDDAQELNLQTMENLHLLSKMKAGRQRLLQIIMSGRHDVLAKLEDAGENGNDGGINTCSRLLPFDEAEVSSYILHRLRIAGCDRQVFSMAALASIAVYSRGIPLYVNMLCRQCLSLAVSNNLPLIEENMVDDAAYDLVLRAQPADAWGPSPGGAVQQSSRARRDRRGLRLVEKS